MQIYYSTDYFYYSVACDTSGTPDACVHSTSSSATDVASPAAPILFTFIFNILLDNYINAIWMAVKLLLVCNATYIYSRTITVAQLAKTVRTICKPLEIFKINTEEIVYQGSQQICGLMAFE